MSGKMYSKNTAKNIFCNYEVTDRRLFLSLHKAKDALARANRTPVKIDEFFDFLSKNYPNISQYVEFITFYSFNFQEKNQSFQYDIAYMYTKPDYTFRKDFFNERDNITKCTGWYPYMTGSRAYFNNLTPEKAYRKWGITKRRIPHLNIDAPVSMFNVAKDYAGTAILLNCSNGAILFDTAFGIEPSIIPQISYIFISHFHQDHTGGIFEILRQREIPVFLSSLTLEYLLMLHGINDSDKTLLLKNSIVTDGLHKLHYVSQTLEFFNSYHCPGSEGCIYKNTDQVIVYPGDMCLSNGFYNYEPDFSADMSKFNQHKTVLLDCALIKKSNLKKEDISFSDVEKLVFSEALCRDTVLVAKGTEVLLNVYLRLFVTSVIQNTDSIFVVNDDVCQLLKNMLRSWYVPKYKKDPFIRAMLSSNRYNFSETWRLFPVSAASQLENVNNVIYILGLSDISNIGNSILVHKPTTFIVGPLAFDSNADKYVATIDSNDVYYSGSAEWSFHSNISDLSAFVTQDIDQYTLFHNYPNALKKFKKSLPELAAKRISIIQSNPTTL